MPGLGTSPRSAAGCLRGSWPPAKYKTDITVPPFWRIKRREAYLRLSTETTYFFSVDERRRLQRLLPFSRHEEPFPLPPLEWSVDWSMDWSWWTYTSSFHIGGGRDDGDGGLLLHLAGVLLLDYYAAEGIGAALPRRLYFEVTRLEVHEKFGSAISSLAASTTTETGGCYPSWLGRFC